MQYNKSNDKCHGLNCYCRVFHALVIQVGIVLLEKCGQSAAIAVLAVVPHEVPPGRIRVQLGC
jgi:hypothetical protein